MTNYLYNGVELPALPEWDKETYPYAIIQEMNFGDGPLISFRAYTERPSVDGVWFFVWQTDSPYMLYSQLKDNEWGDVIENGTATNTRYPGTFWTNTDILNPDGSVYLAASDPVPVGGEPESPSSIIPADTYIKKGNKVYKVNGGGSTDIKTFNSVEEMNAANLPDGTIACVPSTGGGGGTTIHTFNSVEEMNAANLPDGTIACVPSDGGGVKIIDLNDEKYEGFGNVIFTNILTMADGTISKLASQDNVSNSVTTDIVDECSADQPIIIRASYDPLGITLDAMVSAKVKETDRDRVGLISYAGTAFYNNGSISALLDIKVTLFSGGTYFITKTTHVLS